MFKKILIRVLAFIGVVFIGTIFYGPFVSIIKNILNYTEPATLLFGFSSMVLGFIFSYVFWSSIIFGALGKKVDYAVIILIFGLAFWNLYESTGVSTFMYVGLLAILIVGNLIGYWLKSTVAKKYPNI